MTNMALTTPVLSFRPLSNRRISLLMGLSSRSRVNVTPCNCYNPRNINHGGEIRKDYHLHRISTSFADKIHRELIETGDEGSISYTSATPAFTKADVQVFVKALECGLHVGLLLIGIGYVFGFLLELYFKFNGEHFFNEFLAGKRNCIEDEDFAKFMRDSQQEVLDN